MTTFKKLQLNLAQRKYFSPNQWFCPLITKGRLRNMENTLTTFKKNSSNSGFKIKVTCSPFLTKTRCGHISKHRSNRLHDNYTFSDKTCYFDFQFCLNVLYFHIAEGRLKSVKSFFFIALTICFVKHLMDCGVGNMSDNPLKFWYICMKIDM